MTDFLTDYGIIIALVCAGAAVVYGLTTTRWLLAKSPGNDEMQRISKAVQDGASAYLLRQYQIIGVVAVVLAIVLAIALDLRTAIGFVIGGAFSGAAGFIGMNVSVRANTPRGRDRPRRRGPGAGGGLQGRRHHGHARRRPGPAGRGRLLRHPALATAPRRRRPSTRSWASASAAR